jgi:hypothetical protein
MHHGTHIFQRFRGDKKKTHTNGQLKKLVRMIKGRYEFVNVLIKELNALLEDRVLYTQQLLE